MKGFAIFDPKMDQRLSNYPQDQLRENFSKCYLNYIILYLNIKSDHIFFSLHFLLMTDLLIRNWIFKILINYSFLFVFDSKSNQKQGGDIVNDCIKF